MRKILLALALAIFAGGALAQSGKTEVLWLGQAAFRITTPGGKVIMIDPWLRTNPKTPANFKTLESVGKLDLILVTHAHFDHFADAPDLAKLNNVPMYGTAGMGTTVATLGILPANLAPRFGKGGTIEPFGPNGVKITATHAEHSSELVWKNPATGKNETHPGGEPVGYILRMENGFTIYHMGDTGLFGDMALIADLYKPDLVLMPIGGHFVMSPQDAAIAVNRYLKPKFVIPMHYGTIPVLKGTPDEFKQALGKTSTQVIVPQPGEKVEF
jgi:L-ascorbate metabolism protein UlaG (beta-lactamase superfamily)